MNRHCMKLFWRTDYMDRHNNELVFNILIFSPPLNPGVFYRFGPVGRFILSSSILV